MSNGPKDKRIISFVGLSLYILVDVLSFHSSTAFLGVDGFVSSLYTPLLILARIVALVSVALVSSRAVALSIRRPFVALACIVISLTAFICIGVGASMGGASFVVLGAVLLGASQGIAGLFWLSTLAAFDYRGSYLFLLSSHACATVLCALILTIAFTWVLPLTAGCVVISNALISYAPLGFEPKYSLRSRAYDIAQHLGKAVATVCLFALASGVMATIAADAASSIEPEYAQFSVLGVSGGVLIIMFIPALVFKQPLKIENGYKVALPLAALGFLVLPGLPNFVASYLVGPLTTTGYMVTGIILSCSIAEASRTARMSPLSLLSVAQSITLSFLFIGTMIGGLFSQYLDQANVGLALIATGLLYLLALAASWLFSVERTERRAPTSEDTSAQLPWKTEANDAAGEVLEDTVQQSSEQPSLELLADSYDFTDQEKAVFMQLAEGRTLARIAQDLYLSTSSVKYHTQKIYRSFDVHSRSELNEAVIQAYQKLFVSDKHHKEGLPEPSAQTLEERRRAEAAEELAEEFALSKRESEVMLLLAKGETLADIARELSISENTARTYIKRIYGKLEVHSKQDIIDLCRSRES